MKVVELGGIGPGPHAGMVLTWSEAAANSHMTARSTVINVNGVEQAAPAPRVSRTPAGPVGPPPSATTPLEQIGW